MCVDCTPVNDVTEAFDWPLPRLQDLRYKIRGSRFFARLDLKDAFFRILVPIGFRIFTSFRCDGKQYQFRRMPFGLKTAPSVFQRFMDTHLSDLGTSYYWYIDDILVHAETRKELRRRVHALKTRLRTKGCVINEEKSVYDQTSILFAGIQITEEGIGPNLTSAHQAVNLPVPRTKKEAQSALGLVSYLRDYIPLISHFDSMLYPDKSGLRLPPDVYESQWRRLMRHLASAMTTLKHVKEGEPMELYTDASNLALGVIIIQFGKVVAVSSRKLTSAETRYSATDREHIALVHAAKRFRLLLHPNTSVWCDHAALITRKPEDLLPKQARWAEIVRQWMPNVRHVKGTNNPADFVSRWPVETWGGVLTI